MKKFLLFGLVCSVFSATAQQNYSSVMLNSRPERPMYSASKTIDMESFINQKQAARKKTRAGAGWMSYQDASFKSGTSAGVYVPMYNDSTPKITPTTGSPFHWWVHGLGTSFYGASEMFYQPLNSSYDNVFQISKFDAYRVDSIEIVGFYNRKHNYTDTLYIELTTNGSATGGATILQSGPDVWYNTNLFLDDSTFRWIASEYNNTANRIVSTASGKVVITKILDAAAYADTTADGIHVWKFPINPGMNIAANAGVGVLVTFKNGHNFPFATELDSTNFWQHLTQEMNGNGTFPTLFTNDRASGIIMTSGDRYRLMNGTDKEYVEVSGKQYTNPTYWYTAPLRYEDPYFSLYVNCATCNPVSASSVDESIKVRVTPNPVRDNMQISLNLNESASQVNFTLTNATGQVVVRQNLGSVSANTAYNTSVDVSSLPSGVYFYTIDANGQKRTDRIIID